jgi:DNA-binding CsgD family transcriptional regulator
MAHGGTSQLRSAKTHRWRKLFTEVKKPLSAPRWRALLAEQLRDAAGTEFVTVGLCPLGDWRKLSFSTYPTAYHSVVELGAREFPGRLEATGDAWVDHVATGSLVQAPRLSTNDGQLADEIDRALLRPHGLASIVAGYVLGPGDAIAGMIVVADRQPDRVLFQTLRDPLEELCARAGEVVRSSLSVAAACGFRMPATNGVAPSLTRREREIAELVAAGLKNVNVAARLRISETTVGTHLRTVYRKLGVHSRVDLARALRDL